jgi:hypothetical protein
VGSDTGIPLDYSRKCGDLPMTAWYLIKRNWPQTANRCPNFAGVGGDVWPLDALEDKNATAVHAAMMASRTHAKVGHGEEALCVRRPVADQYWAEAEKNYGDLWLLKVAVDMNDLDARAGFDLGFPSGGFSVVETELIIQGLPGPALNDWGLIDNKEDALMYMTQRHSNKDLEQVDGLEILAVRVEGRGVLLNSGAGAKHTISTPAAPCPHGQSCFSHQAVNAP